MNTDFITIPLFHHQQQNISNMEKLEKHPIVAIDLETSIETRLGFLSDLPGYGKSLCVLGLIGVTQFDEQEEVYFKETIEMSNLVKKTKTKCLEQVTTSLHIISETSFKNRSGFVLINAPMKLSNPTTPRYALS